MACNVDQLLDDACTNKFTCLPTLRHYDIVLAQLLCELVTTLQTGSGGTQEVFSGSGAPNVSPTATAAIWINTDDGSLYEWYLGAWH